MFVVNFACSQIRLISGGMIYHGSSVGTVSSSWGVSIRDSDKTYLLIKSSLAMDSVFLFVVEPGIST